VTIEVRVERTGQSLHRLLIFSEGTFIGEYERSKEDHIERKMEEILKAQSLLLHIFQQHGEFVVRWDSADKKKSIRVAGAEVGVVPMATGPVVPPPNTLDRSDPRVAAAIVNDLFGGIAPRQRSAALHFLAASIRWASEHADDRWGVTLYENLIRLNVGIVHVLNLESERMTVLVHRDPAVAGVELEAHLYTSADGAQLANVPYPDAERLLPMVLEQHIAALHAAARQRPSPQIRGAHSTGLTMHLWERLDLVGQVPVPEYVDTQSDPPDENLGLEAEHAAMALPDMAVTEKLSVVKSRLAQRLFRSRLAAVDCRCRVTGVTERHLLRASHIRPWAKSDDRQRQDPNNGLLLSPHVDMLFDAGYLTFEDDGTVHFSDRVSKEVLKSWGLHQVKKVAGFSKAQGEYLAYHREHVFLGTPS
jgi:hypothetical protein